MLIHAYALIQSYSAGCPKARERLDAMEINVEGGPYLNIGETVLWTPYHAGYIRLCPLELLVNKEVLGSAFIVLQPSCDFGFLDV